jgi:hypothetical protein
MLATRTKDRSSLPMTVSNMQNPVKRIRRALKLRQTLQFGGLVAVRQGDPRIMPWINVNPHLINFRHATFKDRGTPLFRDDLDFDSSLISIEAFEAFDVRPRFYHEVFNLGLSIDKTTEFRYQMDLISRDGKAWYDFETDKEVLNYLSSKVRLFEDIRRAGELRPNFEISGKRRDEIGCLIDERGRLVKGKSGNNRFAIARLLKIPLVPVQIDAIHAEHIPMVKRVSGTYANRQGQSILAELAREIC